MAIWEQQAVSLPDPGTVPILGGKGGHYWVGEGCSSGGTSDNLHHLILSSMQPDTKGLTSALLNSLHRREETHWWVPGLT